MGVLAVVFDGGTQTKQVFTGIQGLVGRDAEFGRTNDGAVTDSDVVEEVSGFVTHENNNRISAVHALTDQGAVRVGNKHDGNGDQTTCTARPHVENPGAVVDNDTTDGAGPLGGQGFDPEFTRSPVEDADFASDCRSIDKGGIAAQGITPGIGRGAANQRSLDLNGVVAVTPALGSVPGSKVVGAGDGGRLGHKEDDLGRSCSQKTPKGDQHKGR